MFESVYIYIYIYIERERERERERNRTIYKNITVKPLFKNKLLNI